MNKITFATRRARSCYGPHDKMVLHVALYNGAEVCTGRYKPDLIAAAHDAIKRGKWDFGRVAIAADTVVEV